MVILGIDPGFAIIGYGVIQFNKGKSKVMGYGAITTKAGLPFEKRLQIVYNDIIYILEKCKPDIFAIEKLFFNSNQKTAIGVAEARGVTLLAATQKNIPIYEYTPLQIKTVITGYGHALKPQVMDMTKRLLNIKETPKYDDTCDALAIAMCHALTFGNKTKLDIAQKLK